MSKSILDHKTLSERYFLPLKQSFPNPYWVEFDTHRLSCHYSDTHPDGKTIVMFHGENEIVPDFIESFLPDLEKLGFNIFLVEYRGYSMSTGLPSLVEMLDDVTTIIKATKKRLEDIIVFGRSVGAIYAIHAVSQMTKIGGLIIESGIADMFERVESKLDEGEVATFAELKEECVKHFNHKKKLASYRGPSLFLHTLKDQTISYKNSKLLHKWAHQPKDIKIFELGNHDSIMFMNSEEYFDALLDLTKKMK